MKDLYLKIVNSAFWQKWGVWVLIFIIFIIFAKTSFDSFLKGWNSTYCNEGLTSGMQFVYPIIIVFVLLILGGFIFLLGQLHVNYFFKIFVPKPLIKYFVLYGIMSLIFFDIILPDFVLEKLFKLNPEESGNISLAFWSFSLLGSIGIAYYENEKEKVAEMLQKQKLEIKALKAQINPHFLFNTLNNLMGTAISENAPQTSLQIQQLASIMRHVVEETQAEYTPIEKELKFLGDYIELIQIRIPKEEHIKINVKIDFDENSFLVSPLILITFIENAFKYGISISHRCFVDIKLTIENKKIELICKNAIVNLENSTETGLESVRKRLELTYPQNHFLNISKENNVYTVVFNLDLSHENPNI